MKMKTKIPAVHPIMILIRLLSIKRILAGSIGVLISVHLLLLDPKLTNIGLVTIRCVSLELGYIEISVLLYPKSSGAPPYKSQLDMDFIKSPAMPPPAPVDCAKTKKNITVYRYFFQFIIFYRQ